VAGRNAGEADSKFGYFFRESLSVLTGSFLLGAAEGNERILIFKAPVKLDRKGNSCPLYMSVVQTYVVIPSKDGQYKVKTTSYIYSLLSKCNGEIHEVLEFHWHPKSTPKLRWPHLHILGTLNNGEDIHKVHFPTARFCIEDFIRLLIRDFGVKPRLAHSEWKEILVRNKQAFMDSASWLHWEPLI
jgi:hypothetical protein